MPPKKKGGKKGGKKKGAKKTGNKKDGLNEEDKVSKLEHEVTNLQNHLIQRRALSRKANAERFAVGEMQLKVEQQFYEFENDTKEVNAFMIKQYKIMQLTLGKEVDELKLELNKTKLCLVSTQNDLVHKTEESDRIIKEKDTEINDLKMEIESVHKQYDFIINNILDKLQEYLLVDKDQWKINATSLHSESKKTLLDFGITQQFI